MIFYDTETCGLHGPTILIQWALDDGDIHLHDVWISNIQSTITLIEWMMRHKGGVCGFNLAFDHFHLCQTYTTLKLLGEKVGYDECPQDHINMYAELEPLARDGDCLKPQTAVDLMLVARKTEYQSTMDRGDIRIKRIPTVLAHALGHELNKRIPLKDVYFARYADPTKRWSVMDVKDEFGDIVPEFKDVVLKFAPSTALKALAQDALGVDVIKFGEVELDKKFRPVEVGYAPYALSPKYIKDKSTKRYLLQPSPDNWLWTWPDVIEYHITHWGYNKKARQYAEDDVSHTRGLYHYFDSPEAGDVDSLLACMVGAVRWRGYKIDCDKIKTLKTKCEKQLEGAAINFQSPAACKKYLTEVMTDEERIGMLSNGKITTKGIVLEDITKWKNSEVCNECYGEGCDDCTDGLVTTDEQHPAALRAREMLDARHAKKEIETYDKLLQAGRFHASFKVIGALSSRMSGADGLNAQGIKRSTEVRECFPLAWEGQQLCGGDFAGFEVTLMDAAYGDKKLRKLLQSGKKIHGIFGVYLFPGMTYDDILATKGRPNEEDKYTRSKNGVFAMCYGGEEHTLSTRVGIDEETAFEAYQHFASDFPELGDARKRIANMFCSMTQPGGIGTKVVWRDPHDYVESMFGFRRYFEIENMIVKALFDLAADTPAKWKEAKVKVMRRDREQTAHGAVSSALYGAAFGLQASNMRAALNHIIQSSGATLCKELEAEVWTVQPCGIHEWSIMPMNIHDELMTPCKPELAPTVRQIVDNFVTQNREKVPLLDIDWSDKMDTWAEK